MSDDTLYPKCVSAGQDREFIALIGYQDQGNLGLGYLAAVLQKHGYVVEMRDIREGSEQLATDLNHHQPLLIGFSLIFQCFLPEFQQVAHHLRKMGISSHFTIGGHFPSLCPDEVLAHFPELDSIVLYEGEETLVDLVNKLHNKDNWHQIPGIAYLDNKEVVKTKSRALIEDLDSLPFPYRPYEPERTGAFRTLPLLASRGCVRRCSFCSIHKFYRNPPGQVVRVRKPSKVIEEMLYLYNTYNVRIYLFQDDDFPLWSIRGQRWAKELIERLHESGLAKRTIWKISCRGEYIEHDLFSKLRDAGLFLVYLGLESGDEEGLKTLNKQMSAEQNLQAVERLKQLGILSTYGFMLFDPSSTFESIRRNVNFLREIFSDGHAAVAFARMLPYGGTPIREQLQKEGRLRGDLTNPDYEFLDLRLNKYYLLLSNVTSPWLDKQGLSDDLNYAWYEFEAIKRLVQNIQGVEAYQAALRSLTAKSNEKLLSLVEESSLVFEDGESSKFDLTASQRFCKEGRTSLLDIRNSFIIQNIDVLREASTQVCAHAE